jgi:hypothetical protein
MLRLVLTLLLLLLLPAGGEPAAKKATIKATKALAAGTKLADEAKITPFQKAFTPHDGHECGGGCGRVYYHYRHPPYACYCMTVAWNVAMKLPMQLLKMISIVANVWKWKEVFITVQTASCPFPIRSLEMMGGLKLCKNSIVALTKAIKT